ncbi:MAG TPA: 2-oxo acid dehydrogenase subunit E2 [Gaiellaceae bacterium]|nr:2-oxo acid dehydrogenase subunit E2 [Gaiellaceae bacterium]
MRAQGWRKIASATWGRPNDPQIYGDLEVDATRLLSFIDEARRVTGVRITVTHAVGKALARALSEQPHLEGPRPRGGPQTVDIFFVVAIEGGKELSGVKVKGADRMSIVEIAAELAQRAGRIRAGEDTEIGMSKRLLAVTPVWLLRPVLTFASWLTGEKGFDLRRLGMPRRAFGSAMVSSVAMFGVQKAYGPLASLYRIPILALVSEVTMKPIVVDDRIVARPILTVTATMDHRYLDGSHAASLGRSVGAYLTDPAAFETLPEGDVAEARERVT